MNDSEILKLRKDFPWFKSNPNTVYADSAATTLKPKQMVDAICDYYENFTVNCHNVDSLYAYKASQAVIDTRKTIANLLNVSLNEVIFTSGATESLTLIAHALKDFLKKDDEIILSYYEHASNIIPWLDACEQKQSKIVWVGKGFKPTEEMFLKAITKKTRIVSFVNISNILGYELDFYKLSKKIKQINKDIIICIDATQAIPHVKFDIKKADIDFLAFSGHKILGPTGIGVCYINKKWLKKIKPLRLGGGMNSTIRPDGFTYADGVDKFEGGTPHIAGIIGLNATVKYLNKIGWDKINQHEIELKKYITKQLGNIKNIEYYSKDTKYPIVFFNIKGVHAQDLANYLGSKNIVVRSGLSCCKVSTVITHVDAAVRASFYFYNTKKDVDKLVEALKTFKRGAELDNVI